MLFTTPVLPPAWRLQQPVSSVGLQFGVKAPQLGLDGAMRAWQKRHEFAG